ncbi:hypothetical protein BHY07_12750 [Bacillus subtilis subsp. subtilis]|nr:hypothetical protein QU35_12770 [Bacillus subtilis subsp. subtilis str. 168]AIY97962.1 hypothetical protein QX56_12760 [Bacillus subtilis]AJE95035.1 hypothetical protein RP72_12650 [Bacillus subtilis subsp. subtilis]AKC47910.1 hypothetical protein O7A_12760 [Bacillus subtilis KCTC 1028 = ATCC 6051a]AMB24587.1 hypothetical protein AWM80_11635 [Bacillus subtilis subsp. subtilis]
MKWEETKDTQGVCQNFGQFVLPPSQVFVCPPHPLSIPHFSRLRFEMVKYFT